MHMTVKTLCLQVFTEVIGLCLSLGVGGEISVRIAQV